MPRPYVALLGKAVRRIAQTRGGGSALPGLLVEKVDPSFVRRTLAQLPRGVVVVSGSNGKTTTTKIVVELLASQGIRAFTNRTGSNFTRGVASALLGEIDSRGRLDADIAVLELDEAHAVHFVEAVPPRHCLLLNVARDQLDRFGEIDTTAALLARIAHTTTDTVVLNREDPRVVTAAGAVKGRRIRYFGLGPHVGELFPNDDELRGPHPTAPVRTIPADVVLTHVDGSTTRFRVGQRDVATRLAVPGMHNAFNAAAALALVRAVVDDGLDETRLVEALSRVSPAFGRGERLTVRGQPLELVLVKNPSGFRISLASFDPAGVDTMIAINDNYADGRDMSWLWDVDFDSLRQTGVRVVTGTRAYDMALRLRYDHVPVGLVTGDLTEGLRRFLSSSAGRPRRVYCTYTAMLRLRRELGKITEVELVS